MSWKTFFIYGPFVLAAFSYAALIIPARVGVRAKAIWAMALLACASKFLVFSQFGGSAFNPELPGSVILLCDWGCSGLVFLAPLSLLFAFFRFPLKMLLLPLVAWVLAAVGIWNGLRSPVVREIDLAFENLPASLEGYRLAQVADIHCSSVSRRWRTQMIVDRVNGLKPDLICLAGDYVDGRVARRAKDLLPIDSFRARDGVYAVTGNHEYYFNFPEWKGRFYDKLKNVRFLTNECVFPHPGLALGGVPEEGGFSRRMDALPDVRQAFAAASNGEFRVLLQHRPKDALINAREVGVRLQLSGHTHGGVAPLANYVVARANGGFVRGIYRLGNSILSVSPGCGQWEGFPMRFFNPSEIILITLRRAVAEKSNAAIEREIVVYGSSPAAISAAIQAKRMGKTCVIVSPETRIGGLTTGGLGQTDIGNKSAFGGLALDFYKDVAKYYEDDGNWMWQKRSEYKHVEQGVAVTKGSMWVFEPSAALKILEEWERREGLEIHRGKRLDRGEGKVKVECKGQTRRIVSFVSEDGTEYRGKMFVDATYEGDLMAAAGVSYAVGREANATYGETLNGAQTAQAIYHQFKKNVDPYVEKGNPHSGLLPGIEPKEAVIDGTGDCRVQAYCFRMCLTDAPENRIPFAKPADYDERDYELLFRNFEAGETGFPWINSSMPNRKTDTNNRTGVSTDFIGQNWNWPEASYAERDRILAAHLKYQRGLMWTLANHPRVPEKIRREVSRWGTCRDEFADGLGDGWQAQLYVREGRRMVGDYVMTEQNCRKDRVAPHPVAMAAYNMDSHNVRRYVGADGFVHNEGDVEVNCSAGPYGIDYGAIIPKRGECANLFVPVCLSASHIAFGSIRMEPVFFALGQAAGTAAAQAVDAKCAVQDLPYPPLAARLLADGQVLPGGSIDPYVPYAFVMDGVSNAVADIRHIRATTGLRRFYLCGPNFRGVMFAPFDKDLYARMGAEMGEVKRQLSDTDIELGWWCTPSIRYVSNLPKVEDAWGNKCVDNKHCPLSKEFQADWAAKVKSVVETFHPPRINIEDDYTLTFARGLTGAPCYCPRHLAAFAKRYGKALKGPEIAAAFKNRTSENLAIRRAFAEVMGESLVELARKVRAVVDEVDPSIRISLCEPGEFERCGGVVEDVARAFAGKTRPIVRPYGAIYGAQTTPADIPGAVAHTLYTLEHLPRDIETYYEADPYPHNRFYTSASQMLSLMSGAMFMGSQNLQFYCLQYLDDPLEDAGYANAYNAIKPRLAAVRAFIELEKSRLAGVRIVWQLQDMLLTRGAGYGHGAQLPHAAFLLAKMGIPYTTRRDESLPAILIGHAAETMGDEELRALLSGGVLLDAPAADLLVKRGLGEYLGADIALASQRLPITGESILPAAGCLRAGKKVNAFYIFNAGTEGTVEKFATLKPAAGTEVWSEFTGLGGKLVTPSLTVATNALGGRVAVLATSLIGNRASGLYNLRKQELLHNLFDRLMPGALPVSAVDAPGIWTMAQVAADGRSMMVMVNNLSGDVRNDVTLSFAPDWQGAPLARLDEQGRPVALTQTASRVVLPLKFDQMSPEFLLVTR